MAADPEEEQARQQQLQRPGNVPQDTSAASWADPAWVPTVSVPRILVGDRTIRNRACCTTDIKIKNDTAHDIKYQVNRNEIEIELFSDQGGSVAGEVEGDGTGQLPGDPSGSNARIGAKMAGTRDWRSQQKTKELLKDRPQQGTIHPGGSRTFATKHSAGHANLLFSFGIVHEHVTYLIAREVEVSPGEKITLDDWESKMRKDLKKKGMSAEHINQEVNAIKHAPPDRECCIIS